MIAPSEYSRDWFNRCSLALPVIDFLTMVILFSLMVGQGLLLVVKHSVLPIEARQAADGERLRVAYTKLQGLGEIAGRDIPPVHIPDVGSNGERNLLRRLHSIGLADEAISTSGALVAKIEGDILQTIMNDERAFWKDRAAELCQLDEPVPAPPQLPPQAGLVEGLDFGRKLTTYRDHIWELHDRCVESKKEIIGEKLLRFKYNKYDEFDMTLEQVTAAKQEIRHLVDKYRSFRNIYVAGHCDPKGDEDYNYQLSFMRALYVAEIIRQHLDANGLWEGRDYFLNVAGYSWRRQLPRELSESEAAWHSRLRRIEIGFQRIRSP